MPIYLGNNKISEINFGGGGTPIDKAYVGNNLVYEREQEYKNLFVNVNGNFANAPLKKEFYKITNTSGSNPFYAILYGKNNIRVLSGMKPSTAYIQDKYAPAITISGNSIKVEPYSNDASSVILEVNLPLLYPKYAGYSLKISFDYTTLYNGSAGFPGCVYSINSAGYNYIRQYYDSNYPFFDGSNSGIPGNNSVNIGRLPGIAQYGSFGTKSGKFTQTFNQPGDLRAIVIGTVGYSGGLKWLELSNLLLTPWNVNYNEYPIATVEQDRKRLQKLGYNV